LVLHPSIAQYIPKFLLSFLFFIPRLFWPRIFRGNNFHILVLCFAVSLLVIYLWAVLHRWSQRYQFSEGRITCESRFFSRTSKTISYSNIQDITVVQSLFQRLLGIGNVLIDTSGTGGIEAVLVGVPDPDGIEDYIYARTPKSTAIQGAEIEKF